jgi:thiamine-phosphate pyrophosphorylase
MRDDADTIVRIIDVNLNRLREALRVVEEYYRFGAGDEAKAASLKGLRHGLQAIQEAVGRERLLACRDTANDPFADVNRPEELSRRTLADAVSANLKRAQEAARVLEEYVKLLNLPDACEQAKQTRFALYALEKKLLGGGTH